MTISQQDRERLRALAARQAELAHSPAMEKLRGEWERHGRFEKGARPMIRIELWTFEQDVLPPLMRCQGEDARKIERTLLANMVNYELFDDDTLVPAYYTVARRQRFTPFGLAVRRQETSGVGHHFIPYLKDLDEDFHLLGPSDFEASPQAEKDEISQLQDVFGDLLPVRTAGYSLVCCPTQDIVHIMNMEDMYLAMFDTPERFEQMMDQLTADYLKFFEMLQQRGLLQSAARDQHLCQGSYCFTDRLPDEKEGASLDELWLYMDSQETSGISPALYARQVFPYYQRVMERFGLVSYGCCEPVHAIWEPCLSKVKNLAKVSISPWCDEHYMGERLAGRDTVYLRKPTPNLLGVGSTLDEDEVRRHFSATARAARGCCLEIAQRDVYELHNTPDKVRRYVELIRQTLERDWQ